ncbi:head decoration protein [Breoghania sp. JC706]|uniref:head decoration protein n=1 Tax=Breoghania sp. JC706 TaxID=3117732 RepID=UPI00300884AB
MDMKTEKARNLAYLLSEANGSRSRDVVTIASGEGGLEAGTVLGQVTATKNYVVSPDAETAGKEGAETASAILAYGVDATDADVEAVVTSADAEVKAPMLIYHASVDSAAKVTAKQTQLGLAGIKTR